MLTSRLLAAIGGLEHGFGTRHSGLTQEAMASLKQIHSNRVLIAGRAGSLGEADALVTAVPGVAVSVRTADCIPILLADPRTGAVAAVHAGWRGTAARIAGETLERMRAEFGTRTEDVLAAIGPGIGECCYEVGPDVARQFGEAGPRLNLAGLNRRQLEEAGVRPAHIDVISPCTFCDDRFFSYRREGERAGRMISFIRRIGV
jgi:YfiH family protein